MFFFFFRIGIILAFGDATSFHHTNVIKILFKGKARIVSLVIEYEIFSLLKAYSNVNRISQAVVFIEGTVGRL